MGKKKVSRKKTGLRSIAKAECAGRTGLEVGSNEGVPNQAMVWGWMTM